MKSLKNILRKISLFISILLVLSLLALIYKAYVINQPCKHELVKASKLNRINVTNDQIIRLQKALRFQTISYSQKNQNVEAIIAYGIFIREGISNVFMYNTIPGSQKEPSPWCRE